MKSENGYGLCVCAREIHRLKVALTDLLTLGYFLIAAMPLIMLVLCADNVSSGYSTLAVLRSTEESITPLRVSQHFGALFITLLLSRAYALASRPSAISPVAPLSFAYKVAISVRTEKTECSNITVHLVNPELSAFGDIHVCQHSMTSARQLRTDLTLCASFKVSLR